MLMERQQFFDTEDEMKGLGKIPMTFIRAPYIADVYGNAETLAVVDGKVVAARQGQPACNCVSSELNDGYKCACIFCRNDKKEARHRLYRNVIYNMKTEILSFKI